LPFVRRLAGFHIYHVVFHLGLLCNFKYGFELC